MITIFTIGMICFTAGYLLGWDHGIKEFTPDDIEEDEEIEI